MRSGTAYALASTSARAVAPKLATWTARRPSGWPLVRRLCAPAASHQQQPSAPAPAVSAAAAPPPARPPRPALVLTVGWLGATAAPFAKYTDLWAQLGAGEAGAAGTQVHGSSSSSDSSSRDGSSSASSSSSSGGGAGPGQPLPASHSSSGLYTVVGVRPPMAAIMLPAYGDAVTRAAVDRLLAAAEAQPDAPLLVHLFSGGGFIFVAWLAAALAADGRPAARRLLADRLAGIILDSSPAPVNAATAARAIVAAVLRQPAEGIQQRPPWLVGPLSAAADAYLQLPFIQARLAGVAAAWAGPVPATAPQLYLYSEADALVAPATVEAFMRQQEARGVAVTSRRWPESAHVAHLKAHPAEYAGLVAGWAAGALDVYAARQWKAAGLGGGEVEPGAGSEQPAGADAGTVVGAESVGAGGAKQQLERGV